MDILQIKDMCEGATYAKDLDVLERLFNNTGDCVMNGYLGSGIQNISVDSLSHLEFESFKSAGDLETISTGCVLTDSVLIKQTQRRKNESFHQIFSWNGELNSYLWLQFNDVDAMDYSYERIKTFDESLDNSDLIQQLGKMGIPMDNISKVGSESVSSLNDMVDEVLDVNDKGEKLSINIL